MKELMQRFRAAEHGSEYLMRIVAAWLTALSVSMLCNYSATVFTKDYAGRINLPLTLILAVGAYLLFTSLRYFKPLRSMKTDAVALLAASGGYACISARYYFLQNGRGTDFLLGCAPLLALVVWYTVGKYELKVPNWMKKCFIAVLVLSAAFMLTFTAAAMAMRYFNLYTPCFDFGIFTQMFENMKDGLGAVTTVERNTELSHFAVHFSPAYYLMLPVYILFPHPITLQIMQGVFVTSGIIPVYLIARKYGFTKFHSSLLCAVYALYPAFTGGCTYDIHENCMLPVFLLWLIWAIEKNRLIPMAVFALLTLSVKEDAAVYVAVIGLYLILSDRELRIRKAGGALLIGAVLYFIAVCAYINSQGLGVMEWRYSDYIYSSGSGFIAVIYSVISNPAYVLANLFSGEKLIFALQTVGVLGFMPLISKKLARYVLLIPFVLINLMPSYTYQHSVYFQYVFGSCAILIWLYIMNVSQISANKAKCFTVFSLVTCAVAFISTMSGVAQNFIIKEAEVKSAVISYLEQLPDIEGESITANTYFIAPLYKQKELYTINDRPTPNEESAPLSDIILLDRNNANFEVNYTYFIAHGMKEVQVEDTLVSKRLCRLEKTADAVN